MKAVLMEIQVRSWVIEVRFWDQVKTLVEPAVLDMKVRRKMDAVIATQKYGTSLVHIH